MPIAPPIPRRDMPPPDGPPVGPAMSRLVLASPARGATALSGMGSAIAHVAAFVALAAVVARPPPPAPPEPAVEMVFAEPVAVEEPIQELANVDPLPPLPEPPPPEPIPEPPPKLAEPPPPKPVPKPRPVVAKPTQTPKVADAAPVAPPMASPSVDDAPVVDPGWQRAVATWLATRKTYPEDARRRGEEGRVSVRFVVGRDGRVEDVDIVGSSGSERLDNATLTLLRGASLPAFPTVMVRERVAITTSVRYSLR